MRSAMSALGLFLLAGLVAVGTSCASANGFGFREQSCDVDQRLEELMDAWDCARSGDCDQNEGHVVIDCDRVRNQLEGLAFEFPRHVPTLMANAVVAYESKDNVKTARYLDAVFDVEGMHREAALLRCRISIEEGNLPAAMRLIERQVHYLPDDAELREVHAAALYMSGDFASARSALDVAEVLGAPAWRVAFHRGLIAESKGEAREAERHYQDALRENPEAQNARSRLNGLRAVHDATSGDVDAPHGGKQARNTGGKGRSGYANLSGQ
jgi:tetratricopeptide (TPR) repeat protein